MHGLDRKAQRERNILTNSFEHRMYDDASGVIHYWVTACDLESKSVCAPLSELPSVSNTSSKALSQSSHSSSPDSTIVFLPGLAADHHLFDKQLEYFAGTLGRRCLVWDTPSHGLSRSYPLTWSLNGLAFSLHNILQAEGIKTCTLVGQSLGGYLAQAYGQHYSDEVSSIISLDATALDRSYYTIWDLVLLRLTKVVLLPLPWKLLVRLATEKCASTDYGQTLMRSMIESYSKCEYINLMSHGFRIIAQALEHSRASSALTIPTLAICGATDELGFIKRCNRAWEARTNMPVHWIEGARHNSNTDAPDQINALIERFLQEN